MLTFHTVIESHIFPPFDFSLQEIVAEQSLQSCEMIIAAASGTSAFDFAKTCTNGHQEHSNSQEYESTTKSLASDLVATISENLRRILNGLHQTLVPNREWRRCEPEQREAQRKPATEAAQQNASQLGRGVQLVLVQEQLTRFLISRVQASSAVSPPSPSERCPLTLAARGALCNMPSCRVVGEQQP
jgi:hypothetical protein